MDDQTQNPNSNPVMPASPEPSQGGPVGDPTVGVAVPGQQVPPVAPEPIVPVNVPVAPVVPGGMPQAPEPVIMPTPVAMPEPAVPTPAPMTEPNQQDAGQPVGMPGVSSENPVSPDASQGGQPGGQGVV